MRNIFVIIVIIIVIAVFIVVYYNNSVKIKEFDVDDYQYYIENFPSKENIGYISNTKDLLKKVESIWIEKYGESIKKEKPYQVYYDELNGIWMVQGSISPNTMGGVANIIVKNDTGEVLSIWHGK